MQKYFLFVFLVLIFSSCKTQITTLDPWNGIWITISNNSPFQIQITNDDPSSPDNYTIQSLREKEELNISLKKQTSNSLGLLIPDNINDSLMSLNALLIESNIIRLMLIHSNESTVSEKLYYLERVKK